MEPLLGFGSGLLAADDGHQHYGLRRDEAVVVLDIAPGASGYPPRLVAVNRWGSVLVLDSIDVVVSNPAGPTWTPEWIGEMTARRQAKP